MICDFNSSNKIKLWNEQNHRLVIKSFKDLFRLILIHYYFCKIKKIPMFMHKNVHMTMAYVNRKSFRCSSTNLDFIQSRSAWLLYRWSVCLWGRWSGLGWAAQSSPPSIGRARAASPSGTRPRWTTRTRTWSSLQNIK